MKNLIPCPTQIALLLALFLSVAPGHAAIKIPLYTYYAGPPYAVDIPNSLTVQLAQWLTRRSEGRYEFEARHLPRSRLDLLISQPRWSGVVAWANPVWFDDKERQRYLWSHPYMNDMDLVASHRDRPVDFRNADSLIGLTLGGILGRRYNDIDQIIRAGQLVRDDASDEEQALFKLKHKRVDIIFIQASSLPYYRQQYPDLDQWLYVAPNPRRTMQRYLLVDRNEQALMQMLNTALLTMARDPDWLRLLPSRTAQKSRG